MTARFLGQAVILRCTKNVIDFPWVFETLILYIDATKLRTQNIKSQLTVS